LQNEGFDVIIVDDLSNTSLKVLDGIDGLQEKFRHSKVDLQDKNKCRIFQRHHDISGVIILQLLKR
jgi:UDP-glucose 4-epimerase